MKHLFVYGTLRDDPRHEMNRVLSRHAVFLEEGWVRGRLYDLGEYPGAVPSAAEDAVIRGEVYELADEEAVLPALDEYEGCGPGDAEPHEFRRAEVQVMLDSGGSVPAWIYWYNEAMPRGRLIPTGDYLNRHEVS